jgi:hypothetical protein
LGLGADEAFARVTPLGGTAFGLAFRCANDSVVDEDWAEEGPAQPRWQPMLLIDELSAVVQHALVAEGALTSLDMR